MVVNPVGKNELNLYKQQVADQIKAINEQIQNLRESEIDADTRQFQVLKAELKDNISVISKRLETLATKQKDSDEGVNTVQLVRLDEKISDLNKRLSDLNVKINNVDDEFKKLPGSNFLIKSNLEDKIRALSHQVQQIRVEKDTSPAELEQTKVFLNEKISVINKRLQNAIDSSALDSTSKELEVFKAGMNEKIGVLNKQLNSVRKELDSFIERPEFDFEEVSARVFNRVETLIESLVFEQVPIISGSFSVSITNPGDYWEGKVLIPKFKPQDTIVFQVQAANVETRISGRTTDFKVNVVERKNNEVLWELMSYAKVLSGTVNIMYLWSK